MKVRLADPFGDPLLIGKGDPRMRSLRKTGTGSGGGGGTDDGGDDSDSDDSEDNTDDSEDAEEGESEEDDDKKDEGGELQKAIRRRDRALARARKAEAALAEATKKKEEDDSGPSAEERANARLVRAEAKSQLAAIGITDKDDQRAILDVLRLDDIEVDQDGDVDDDAVEERISELRRIFGSGSAPTRRVPKSTSAKDKGGNSNKPSDPDAARYRRIMGAR